MSGSTRSHLPRRTTSLLAAASIVGGTAFGCAGVPRRVLVPEPHVSRNTLGPGDIFSVRVFGEPDLTQEYRVSDDGTIDVPFAGRVRAQGLETAQLADRVRDALRERQILLNPQVSVNVREVNSRRVSVLGQVQHPGTFSFQHGMTIVQAITLAGGYTQLADRNATRLTRRNDSTRVSQETYRVPVNEILEDRAVNVVLAPGDVIYVPEGML